MYYENRYFKRTALNEQRRKCTTHGSLSKWYCNYIIEFLSQLITYLFKRPRYTCRHIHVFPTHFTTRFQKKLIRMRFSLVLPLFMHVVFLYESSLLAIIIPYTSRFSCQTSIDLEKIISEISITISDHLQRLGIVWITSTVKCELTWGGGKTCAGWIFWNGVTDNPNYPENAWQ